LYSEFTPRLTDQLAQPSQVFGVRALVIEAWNFQKAGQASEGGMIDDGAESFQADLTFPHIGVPIAVRAERVAGDIQVQRHQSVEADCPVELDHRLVQVIRGKNRVARGEDVAGVQADLETR